METTKELYERAKAKAGVRSDYEFAKNFGVSRQVVSKWTNGRNSFDDDNAELIASILEVDEAYVIACAHAERAKGEHAKGRWARIAALVVASSVPPAAGAAPVSFDNNTAPARIIQGSEYTLLRC